MALAEGMRPLYFRATNAAAFFGRRLTGTNFHPFSGALSFTSVSNVLWELATIFGSARIGTIDAERYVTIHAIGDDLTWAPYHAHDDLLWLERPANRGRPPGDSQADRTLPAAAGPLAATVPQAHAPVPGAQGPQQAPPTQASPDHRRPAASGHATPPQLGRYKYSVAGLIRLVDRLDAQEELPVGMVMEILSVRTPSGLKDYRRFLESGHAVVTSKETWLAMEPLRRLAIALRNVDVAGVRAALHTFPSYEALERMLGHQEVGTAIDGSVFGRASATFTALAEITALGALVRGVGFFVTPTVPDDETFAELATQAFDSLQGDGRWVATGRWLEQLIVSAGIHPDMARRRLQTASAAGLIRRITEGSTTETRYDRHTLQVLDVNEGVPCVKTEYLYRGDFLIPGKSSSSLRIERTAR